MAQKRACDACYKRKIQCDWENAQERCDWCSHQGLACTFNRVRGRKKACRARAAQSTRSAIQTNQGEPKRLMAEKDYTPSFSIGESAAHTTLLQPYQSRSPSITNSPSHKDSVSYCQINYDGCHFGHLSHHNGMPLLNEEGRRWISSRTGEEVSFRKFDSRSYQHAMPHHFLKPERYATAEDIYELPERRLVDAVFDVFIHSAFSKVFPIVDRHLFPETLDLAYESKSDPVSMEAVSAKVCVLAFMSSICLFKERDTNIPSLNVEQCVIKARILLSFTAEEASLTTLQAVFMLVLHETTSGHLQSTLAFHALACRLVFKLGGHIQLPPKQIVTRADRERMQIRTLFWLCYIIDKDTALRTGQPPLISGDYCDLTLPDGYADCYTYLPHLDHNVPLSESETALTPHLPEDPSLSHIKEKVSRRLYSAQTAKRTNAELLRDIRELDEELEAWRLSIPAGFRPALSISHESRVDVGEMPLPRSMAHITLHLGYHHVMTAIHRASARCMPSSETATDAEEWLPGVRSSMALALEASRSTLVYLRAAMRGVAGEAFWVIVFYPTAAMMTLFCNILMDPLNPNVEEDVALLASTADLVHSLPIQRLTSYELAHIELVTEFVAELCRLSKKAIAKAKAEHGHRSVICNGHLVL